MKIYCNTNKSIFEKLAGKNIWAKGTATRISDGNNSYSIVCWIKVISATSNKCFFNIVSMLAMRANCVIDCNINGAYSMSKGDSFNGKLVYTINYPEECLTQSEFEEICSQDGWETILFEEYSGEV